MTTSQKITIDNQLVVKNILLIWVTRLNFEACLLEKRIIKAEVLAYRY